MTVGPGLPPVALGARPRLVPGARLQTDWATGRPALLYPEGVLLLNPTSGEILELCDGRRNVEDVLAALAERYESDPAEIQADVLEYLGELRERGLLELAGDTK